MLSKFKSDLAKSLAKETNLQTDQIEASFELSEHADLTTKIAFIFSQKEKKNPVVLATDLAKNLNHRYIKKVETKGPYINIFFSNEFYSDSLKEILKQKHNFGKGKKTKKMVMMEFFHANTHKGAHIGHIRNISIGESVSRILEFFGYAVIRVNYQGDIGPHVAKCLWGFINLYNCQAPKQDRGLWLGKVYTESSKRASGDPEVEKQIKEINLKLYKEDKEIAEIWKTTRQWCLDDFETFYKEFNVKFDELYFESQTQKTGMKIAQHLLKKGIAKSDQGATIIDLKDQDLGVVIIITKEGYPLYHTKEIGLAKIKFDKYKNIAKSIHVVGREQEYYFKQFFAALKKIGMKKIADISYHLIYDLVMLPEGKMSSREGTMVLYADLKDKLLLVTQDEIKKRHVDWSDKEVEQTALQITLAAMKFSMLKREHNKVITFDWNEALSLEGDSAPYLQYATVRANSILRNTVEIPLADKTFNFNKEEKDLIKSLICFPEVVQKSAHDLSPNLLASYLLVLASLFNKFYNVSPILKSEDSKERKTRLAITASFATVIKKGLDLLNITSPERM